MKKKIALTTLLLFVSAALIGCAAATTGNVMVTEITTVAALSNAVDMDASAASGAGAGAATDTGAPPANTVIAITPAPTPSPTLAPPTAGLILSDRTAEPTIEPTSEPTPDFSVTDMEDEKGYVYAGTVNLRSGPDTDYELVAEYERGDKLTITGETGEWYRVEIDGAEGYMLKEYVKTGSMPTPSPTPKRTEKPEPTATPEPTQTDTPPPSNGNANSAGGFSAAEIYLVAQLVSRESGKDMDGYRAVANVVYNRVMSSKFPNTVEGVVFQSGQFSPADDEAKLRAVTPSSDVVKAVEEVFGGSTLLPSNVLFFRSASKGTSWTSSRTYYATYGGNAFFS